MFSANESCQADTETQHGHEPILNSRHNHGCRAKFQKERFESYGSVDETQTQKRDRE